jgi:transcription antitermination factor NusG
VDEAIGSGRWYCVAVEPQHERSVRDRADDLSIEAYYPTGKRLIRRRGPSRARQLVEVDRPAMPGYVLVRADGRFPAFRRALDAPDVVPHCLGFLSTEEGPEPIPGAVVDDLKARAEAGDFDQLAGDGRYRAPRWVKPGAKARIVAGPLKDKLAEVLRLTKRGYVAVWVLMLGGPRLIEAPLDWVARLK